MRKKRLMELKPLKVMNRHIADAKKTEISLSPLEKQRGEPGKYRMYCRAAVEKGIMKRKKQTVDKMDFIVQKTHWIVSAIIRIGKIPCIT